MRSPSLYIALFSLAAAGLSAADLRIGMVGLDTGHVIAFTKILHDATAKDHVPGARVVGAFPAASRDIESSWSRVDGYTEKLRQDFGVRIHESMEELFRYIDAVMIESVDGRSHLAQARAAILAGKPVYIEKPIAASLKEAIEIFALARKHRVPVFSSSALRYGRETQAVRAGKIGRVVRAETHSPASLEPHHTDLFWYGIHGVESLFTVMGTGIESVVRRQSTPGAIETVGQWRGGRTGTFREIKGYGGRAVGEKGEAVVGRFDGYGGLVAAIVTFFKTGIPPVPEQETLEILAFMEADALSKERGGAPVEIAEVMQRAGWTPPAPRALIRPGPLDP